MMRLVGIQDEGFQMIKIFAVYINLYIIVTEMVMLWRVMVITTVLLNAVFKR